VPDIIGQPPTCSMCRPGCWAATPSDFSWGWRPGGSWPNHGGVRLGRLEGYLCEDDVCYLDLHNSCPRTRCATPAIPDSARPRQFRGEYLYFCGNSLGLRPARPCRRGAVRELAEPGRRGHFRVIRPGCPSTGGSRAPSAHVGLQPAEVVVMVNLTTNLHLL
jgi:hypothetical protein